MPAAAVASFTPAISGMAGTSVGASGETVVDMGFPHGESKRQRSVSSHPAQRERVVSSPSPGGRGSIANEMSDRGGVAVLSSRTVSLLSDHPTPSRAATHRSPTLPLQGRVAPNLF